MQKKEKLTPFHEIAVTKLSKHLHTCDLLLKSPSLKRVRRFKAYLVKTPAAKRTLISFIYYTRKPR